MKRLLLLAALFTCFSVFAQPSDSSLAIIPQPVSIQRTNGSFTLPANLVIETPPEAKAIAAYLSKKISTPTGYAVTVKEGNTPGSGKIKLQLTNDKSYKKEQYNLQSSPDGIVITAADPAGLFYGVQTLLQLLPPAIEANTVQTQAKWSVPAVTITDYPRFGWRGLMFDVSRHFFTKDQVKQFIDQMARYKFNLLHLHLTDDQGWRIEIKAYPKLTEVGAWNVQKTGTFNKFSAPADDEPRNFGGFFTQDDIRELVVYASAQYVNILPEIDVPGHSLAALAAYPELSCTPGTYKVNSGEPFMVWPPKGHFYGLIDNTLCPANDKVYTFLDKVFTEVAALFPFQYIHMGGDETARNFWEKSEEIKALMKKENLKDLNEVQSYFVKRVEKLVASKGKKLIGWDEILEGGLAPNATVMSWRGIKGGIEATKLGHEVVMSPTNFVYLDYMQGDAAVEPPVYASLRLKTTYEFNPVPDGVDEKLVKGGQGNLWTEQVYNMRHLQYMIWPRAFAIAESVWSPNSRKNWPDFTNRVEKHFDRYSVAGIKYAPSMYDPLIKVTKDSTSLSVNFDTEIEGLDLYYSFDNSYPDNFYPKYTKTAVLVPKDAVLMRVISYRNGKPLGRMISISVEDLQKRAR
ncbi:MAG TPA: beta-N-acetylhexosaminidase [Chitinophagaceae bacterium]|nr:beta-N-acetylhexosaminidase [Chitinophagaceae bacterium]